MPTMTKRLVASYYYIYNSQQYPFSLENESNMYTNTDSTTYATATIGSNNLVSAIRIYLRGFDFSRIPNNATNISYLAKIKFSQDGNANPTESIGTWPCLANGNTQQSSTAQQVVPTTEIQTVTLKNVSSLDWNTIKSWGDNFGIKIGCSTRNGATASFEQYIYGAELEVTYTVPSVIYIKQSASWKSVDKVYKKTNGVWVEQNNLTTVFDSSTNYKRGN